MSRALAELLEMNPAILRADIERLEAAIGHPSIDIRLSTAMAAMRRRKISELGLDARDSTGREIYYALIGMAKLHDEFLARRSGGDSSDPAEELLPKLISLAQSAKGSTNVWALRHSTAKRILKQHAPRKTMRLLGYKSVDSMLKRLPVAEIYAGVRLVESDDWRRKLISLYQGLTPIDFETRPAQIIALRRDRWGEAAAVFARQERHIVTSVQEIGAILVLPGPVDSRPGLSLVVVPHLLAQLNELRTQASYYKLHQMQAGFGQRFAQSIGAGDSGHVFMAGHQVPWRVVHRHFGHDSTGSHPEVFEPHVQADDFSWRKVEAALFRMEPALHFWHDTDYLALNDGRPVSFNLIDAGINLFNRLPYEQRVYYNFQNSLWNELLVRYMGQPALERQVLRQIEHQAMAYAGESINRELV